MANENSSGYTIQNFVGVGKAVNSEVQIQNSTGNFNQIEKQDLTEAAKEIQSLLEQLSQSYPSKTTSDKMILAGKVVEEIENNPTLMQKIIRALKAGSIAAIEEALSHPAASFVISAVEDFRDNN